MPRSSRHKSHKQHKHSSKEVREYSDSEEVGSLKDRKDREDVLVRVSRESGSSEKRKLAASQSVDGNLDEYTASKRRKERSDAAGVDRWNGGEVGRVGSSVGDKEMKGENSRIDSEKGLKSKVSVDSKSNKSSRRHEGSSEKKEVNTVVIVDIEEVKRSSNSSKSESKSKFEKDSSRKETHQYKDSKDKEPGEERNTKVQDVRRERSADKGLVKGVVDSEGSRKQSSHFEERTTKSEVGNTEWLMEEKNPELEKEHDKPMRRKRDGSDEKDKYSELVRDSNGRKLSTKDERHKDEKHKDEKHKDDRYKDRYREDLDRDKVRDHRIRDDRARDDRSLKDHTSDRSDVRHSREESKSAVDSRHKKSKTQNSDRDGSPHHDDRATRYKDYRGKKRSPDDEDRSELKPRNTKEHRYEVEKKVSSGKVESLADRGRSQSRLADGDSVVSGSRRKASPGSGANFSKDSLRHSSKQAELKYKDSMSEERGRANVTSSREITNMSGISERASEYRSTDKLKSTGKPIHNDKNNSTELLPERSPISEAQKSPLQLKEKSPSSTSIDRRPSNRTPVRQSSASNRTPVRQSSDVDDMGHRSGSKDVRDYAVNDDRGSREWPMEKPAGDEFQADGDTMSVPSSFNRTGHLPTNPSSALPPPPPLRSGVDSPVFSSYDEDSRGKSSNRYKRSSDPNVGRGQSGAWKGGVPNWSAPVTNGFNPYQQGPPSGGYHPMMQQFHSLPLFGVRPGMDMNPTGVPYHHITDVDRYPGHGRSSFAWRNRVDEACPPHLHGRDGSNAAFGDEAHMHGKPDWDQNSRHMINDRSWETNADWKGQNTGLGMEYSSASRKEDNQLRAPVDEAWAGKPGQRSRNDRSRSVSRAESIEIKISDDVPSEQVSAEAPKPVVLEKTLEPSKILNDNGFCHVYLSKLDVSVDLTHPELYKQCTSLLDMEVNATDADVTKDLFIEGSGKAAVKISNRPLRAPIFPKIKESLLQRAMAIYRKQSEEMKAKVPVSSFIGTGTKIVPNNEEKLCPDRGLDSQKQDPLSVHSGGNEELILTSGQPNVEEPVPALDNEKADESTVFSSNEKMEDSLANSGKEIADKVLPDSDQGRKKEAVPKSGDSVAEPVQSLGTEAPEELHPSVIHVGKLEPDAVATSNVEPDGVIVSSDKMEDNAMACEVKANCSTRSPEGKKAFSDDTVCGILGVTDGTDACEALQPMSIECKSVNLSRIHSPESTH